MRPAVIALGTLFIAAFGAFEFRDDGALRAAYRNVKHELSDWSAARNLASVDCPAKAFVILALGQSNAANHLGSRSMPQSGARTFAFFRGRCVPLSDPVPGATGDLGSLWPKLGEIVERQARLPIVVIAGAVGGSSVAAWRDDVRRIRSRLLRSVELAVAVNLSPDAIIWIQGESDAARTTAQAYENALRQVIRSIEAGLESAQAKNNRNTKMPEWIISLTSRCDELSPAGSIAVREAQWRVATTTPNARLGPDTDALGYEFRRDGCHFNDAGRSVLAKELAVTLAPTIASAKR